MDHVVSKEDVSVAPKKMEVVNKWMTPTNVTGTISFSELASNYQKFAMKFSKLGTPLTVLPKREQ